MKSLPIPSILSPLLVRGERLCWKSSDMMALRTPRGAMFEHGIEDGEQLAHGRGERELGGFAGAAQAQVKSFKRGVAAHRGEGGHVECGPHLGAATPHRARSAHGAAVAVEWSDPDQL